MLIRRELHDDIPAIRSVIAAAFAEAAHSAPPVEPDGAPGEATLVTWLRADDGWVPRLSLVAVGDGDTVVGHVVCTRAFVVDVPVLGLGPLSVEPGQQRHGVGAALMHAVLGAADALDDPLVALLGDPDYYGRFGFRPASELGILAPDEAWGDYFQTRPLSSYDADIRGRFRYAEPFSRL